MDEGYKQLTLKERKEIEEGLDRGDSFRAIAGLTGRNPSTLGYMSPVEFRKTGLSL